jgi:hypothetical protein
MEKWLTQHLLGRQKNYVKPQSGQAVTLLRFKPGAFQIQVYSITAMYCHLYVLTCLYIKIHACIYIQKCTCTYVIFYQLVTHQVNAVAGLQGVEQLNTERTV